MHLSENWLNKNDVHLKVENKYLRKPIEQEWCSSIYITDLSESRFHKNDVSQFGDQMTQKSDWTKMMWLYLQNRSMRKPMEQKWCSSVYRTNQSENQWNKKDVPGFGEQIYQNNRLNKNEVAQFGEQINQKSDWTRMMN